MTIQAIHLDYRARFKLKNGERKHEKYSCENTMKASELNLLMLVKNPVHLLAFGFGSGLLTPAPGTWGTLLGWILILPFAAHLLLHPYYACIFLLLAFALGIYVCGKTSSDLGEHDYGGIVWDEFVGIWLVVAFLPPNLQRENAWLGYILSFVLFRFFDILKPFPIRQVDQKVTGGFGIMIDDVIAAIFALLVIWALAVIFY